MGDPTPRRQGSRPLPRARIALVVQRYGVEINGGAELLARQIAERLAEHHDVEVLTSCALDYHSWALHYEPGVGSVNGVAVRRFAHPQRHHGGRARIPRPHRARFALRKLLGLLPGGAVAEPDGDETRDGVEFLRRQGPHCAGLLQHLATHRDDYDVGIFVTAQYEPAAQGLLHWKGPGILVPTLHEEKSMFLPHFRRLFWAASRVFYLTTPEQKVARLLYGLPADRGEVVGVGIDPQTPSQADIDDARRRHRLPSDYLVYVGRIDPAKGCGDLLAAFAQRAAAHPGPGLVLVGQKFMDVPDDPRIVATGFVSDADRNAIVAGSRGLVLPSRYESLSLVLLEAMALGVPVLANAECEVLADHVRRSGGGLLYRRAGQLGAALSRLASLDAPERRRLGAGGRAYVAAHYTWPRVMDRYHATIAQLVRGKGVAAAPQTPPVATVSTASSQPRSTTARP